MSVIKRFIGTFAFFSIIAMGMSNAMGAAGFDQFVGLGDSTIDTGYFRYNTTGNASDDSAIAAAIADGAMGGWAGNGTVGVTILGEKFGIDAGSVNNGHGGTNYANGAGFTNAAGPLPGSVAATQQIRNYLASVGGVANPHALYVVSSGNNDLLKYQQFPSTFLTDSATAIAQGVSDLQRAGARTILVPNSFLYAVYAQPGGSMDPANATDYQRCVWYNNLRWSNMTAAGVSFIPADLDSLFKYVVQHPNSFGFTSYSVYSGNAPSPVAAVVSGNSDITQLQQHTFLFVDGHHLTTAGQTIEADYEYSLLAAPSQISLLGESAVQAGWAHAATIQGQLDPCGRICRPCGRNVWTSAGAYGMTVRNAAGFPDSSGTPFGGTVGIDYQTAAGLIFGAAFTSGSQVPGFSSGGHYSQVDEAPSFYAAYVGSSWWGNAVATWDLFQYNIARNVQLGYYFTDYNRANTSGQSLGLALRGGRNMCMGRFTTGPVAGLILQDAHIDGFAETSNTGMTALSFEAQTRSSFVTQLGWRISMDGGRFRPFVEAEWNHECAGYNRMVTASLTSINAPSYSMDAVPTLSDWGTTSLGTFYDINSRATLRTTVSSMYMNPQMITCGGEVGLNVSF